MKRICKFFRLRKIDPKWFREMQIELAKMRLKEETIMYRGHFGSKLRSLRVSWRQTGKENPT